ncbi:hypothetical protein [Nonomuraea sp. NPDC050691]|uniref:hypothetical protein n=1 Tax=Nonomuraea sp. NPDC050691 TaxID=3155661 RepID=UPI00340375E2
MNLPTSLAVTLALLVGNGFLVAAGFALVAAKRHRLEKAAAQGSRAAAAAVSGIRELSLMPAGAIVGVGADASAQEVVDASARTGRTRLLVWDGDRALGAVHVRDAYLARARGVEVTAGRLAYTVPTVTSSTVVSDAVAALARFIVGSPCSRMTAES